MKTIKGLALFLAQSVRDHTVRVTEKAFADFADFADCGPVGGPVGGPDGGPDGGTDAAGNPRMLGVHAEAGG